MRFLFSVVLVTFLMCCSENRTEQLTDLKENIDALNDLKEAIEVRYRLRLSDSASERSWLIFSRCELKLELSEDYVCDDHQILEKMDQLNIDEISFQRAGQPCTNISIFNDLFFRKSKGGYPVVFYYYEYCGSKSKFESQTIYYEPVDDHWGLYVDSSFP